MQQLPEFIEVSPEVCLEKIALRHCASMFEQIDRHRDYLANYVDWTRFNIKLEDSQHFVKQCEEDADKGESVVWAICVNDYAMGTISFNKPIDWQNSTVYLGYWLSPEAQGVGIMTQSVNAVIEATNELFSDYILRCAVHNEASNNVAKRCGFEFVETKENAEKIGAVMYAQHIYKKSVGKA